MFVSRRRRFQWNVPFLPSESIENRLPTQNTFEWKDRQEIWGRGWKGFLRKQSGVPWSANISNLRYLQNFVSRASPAFRHKLHISSACIGHPVTLDLPNAHPKKVYKSPNILFFRWSFTGIVKKFDTSFVKTVAVQISHLCVSSYWGREDGAEWTRICAADASHTTVVSLSKAAERGPGPRVKWRAGLSGTRVLFPQYNFTPEASI